MCVAFFALDALPEHPVVLALNRDEFFARPTAPAARWEGVEVVSGRDLKSGGTWLAVGGGGRWALVTNFRDPAEMGRVGRSRGGLVTGWMTSPGDAGAYLAEIHREIVAWPAFNLLVGTGADAWYLGSRDGSIRRVEPGIHGLSNALLDTPWPKVEAGKAGLERLIAAGPPSAEALLGLLDQREVYPDERLPSTGVPLDWERDLSPAFVRRPGAGYGTRTSTAALLDRDGVWTFVERRWGEGGQVEVDGERRFVVGALTSGSSAP